MLPVVGCSSLLLGAGLAYGVSYGNRQAAKIEEFAEYEIKPEAEPEIEITPEMSVEAGDEWGRGEPAASISSVV